MSGHRAGRDPSILTPGAVGGGIELRHVAAEVVAESVADSIAAVASAAGAAAELFSFRHRIKYMKQFNCSHSSNLVSFVIIYM